MSQIGASSLLSGVMLLYAPGGPNTTGSRQSDRGSLSPAGDPTRTEVRNALWWALENDWAAVVEHRATAHATRHAGFRRQADRELVARWRQAVASPARHRASGAG